MLPTTLFSFLLVLPTPATATQAQVPLTQAPNVKPDPVTLHLRHLHSANASRVLFTDISPAFPSQNANAETLYTLDTVLQTRHRPSSFAAHVQTRRHAMRRQAGLSLSNKSVDITWEEEVIVGPDVTNREALYMLAKMANNAYVLPDESEWYDLEGKWNLVSHHAISSVSSGI